MTPNEVGGLLDSFPLFLLGVFVVLVLLFVTFELVHIGIEHPRVGRAMGIWALAFLLVTCGEFLFQSITTKTAAITQTTAERLRAERLRAIWDHAAQEDSADENSESCSGGIPAPR